MTTPTVSIVIPVYVPKSDHAAEVVAGLLRCVRGLIATLPPSPDWVELLAQDDGSPGIDTLEGVLPGMVKLQRNTSNLGFAGNCNAGAARATGRYLLFVNQDAFPLGEWYEPLLATFAAGADADHRVGIVGPKLLFPPEQSPDFPSTGLLAMQSCGGWYDAALQPTHRYLGYREDYPEANKAEEVSWITGAVHCWDRRAFEQVGGYDTAYQGGYFEDVDACCRVQAAGYRVWYCPTARFLHRVASVGGVKADQFRHNAQLFRSRWADTKKVSGDTISIHEAWWA